MKYTSKEREKLIEIAKRENTYICGADGLICGIPREKLPFPCQECKRNKMMKNLTAWINSNKTKAMIFAKNDNGNNVMYLGKITAKNFEQIEKNINNDNIIYNVGDVYFNGLYKTFKTPKVSLKEILL